MCVCQALHTESNERKAIARRNQIILLCLSCIVHRKQLTEDVSSDIAREFFFFFFLRVRQALHRESNEMKVFVRHVYRQKYGELLVCSSSTTHRKQRGECEFVRHIYRQKYGELLVCLSSATHRNVTSR